MIRARFSVPGEDGRPLKWPAPGPFWCSGETLTHHPETGEFTAASQIMIAYARDLAQLLEFWPDAGDIDVEEREKIVFTSRFSCPSWWPEGRTTIGSDA
jgi:hypothetical protein